MKTLFTVKPKDRNDIPGTMEFESHVFDVKKLMKASLGKNGYTTGNKFRPVLRIVSENVQVRLRVGKPVSHAPREVIDAFFEAIENTGICLSKYDVHITIE